MTTTRTSFCLINRTRDRCIADKVEVAASLLARTRGLIGRRSLANGCALVIQPCKGIHTFFMALPIDVVHVDADGQVIMVLRQVKPWRVGPIVLNSFLVIELPAGTADATGMQSGDRVVLVDCSNRVLSPMD